MERRRGITIFAKQAILPLAGVTATLVDTPGHVDFSTEMERTLQILDYAILLISGTDGVQGHTITLWKLLERYGIPTFLFVNKMDLAGSDPAALLSSLRRQFGDGCVAFSGLDGYAPEEDIALLDESALAHFLEHGNVEEDTIAALIRRRMLFPCYFGSALKLSGIDALLRGLNRFARPPVYPAAFGAKVYKISRDAQNNRLTHLKITGGSLAVKASLTGGRLDESTWTEKINQIRLYSGEKFTAVDAVYPGTVCAVTGLSHTYPGQGLGAEPPSPPPTLEPVLSYRLLLPDRSDALGALRQLRQLEEEDPLLAVSWIEETQEIHLHLMGEVQLEILSQILRERFGLEASFDAGHILYRETIAHPVIGRGHFEPLRHYAEVHLLLEPGAQGSGLTFDSACSEDILPRHWQRLILTHLEERAHRGVLTGSPITDMKITLLTGRGHLKHTEGGDFRQATYRAVRQGLMQATSVLLEPWYRFQLDVPADAVGRAMTDLQRLSDDLSLPITEGGRTLFTGSAPVAALREYQAEVTAYTRGMGRLTCSFMGFAPCYRQEEIVAELAYDPERDMANSADSVFCSHGAGFTVKWDQVGKYMHLDSGYKLPETQPETAAKPQTAAVEDVPLIPPTNRTSTANTPDSLALDKELLAIFERTYGPVEHRRFLDRPLQKPDEASPTWKVPLDGHRFEGEEYLLVDGYNILHAWSDLSAVARQDMDAARKILMDILSNYRGFREREIILVFDAYKVPGGERRTERYHNIHVVYTKEAETADAYIERATFDISKKHRVTVATSDGSVQMIILGHGALRLTPRALREEIEQTAADITAIIAANNRRGAAPNVLLTERGSP
jgi:translation elongation factor EF-G/predicted RNA-binding protein with PIN domain